MIDLPQVSKIFAFIDFAFYFGDKDFADDFSRQLPVFSLQGLIFSFLLLADG